MTQILGFDPIPVVRRAFARGWFRLVAAPMSDAEMDLFKNRMATRHCMRRQRGPKRFTL